MINANEVKEAIEVNRFIQKQKEIAENLIEYEKIVKNTINLCETTINSYLEKITTMPVILPFEIEKSFFYKHTRYNHNYFYKVFWTHYTYKKDKRDVSHIGSSYFDWNTLVNYLAYHGFEVSLINCTHLFNQSSGYSSVYRIKIDFIKK